MKRRKRNDYRFFEVYRDIWVEDIAYIEDFIKRHADDESHLEKL